MRDVIAIIFAIFLVVLTAVAIKAPCDGGNWEGFKIAMGGRCR